MPEKIKSGSGMMEREELRFDTTQSASEAEWNAAKAAVEAWADQPTGDKLMQDNAQRCREILATVGLEEMMDKTCAVDTGKLRERGLGENSAQWIAAFWLGAFNRLRKERDRLEMGQGSICMVVEHAKEIGRLQERMFWRCGVDPKTGKRREALALSGRRQVKGGHDGNAMKATKSFAASRGREAQARAKVIATERPDLSWSAIRSILSREYGVSPETIKKALPNPKKAG